jgi:hypothetical protein
LRARAPTLPKPSLGSFLLPVSIFFCNLGITPHFLEKHSAYVKNHYRKINTFLFLQVAISLISCKTTDGEKSVPSLAIYHFFISIN